MNYYTTIAQLNKLKPEISSKRLIFCEETGLFYYFAPSAAAFPINAFSILATGLGGNTRWINVDPLITFNEQTTGGSNVTRYGLRIETGTATCTFFNGNSLQATVVFANQFAFPTILSLVKTSGQSGLTTAQIRTGTLRHISLTSSGFNIRWEHNIGVTQAGDTINIGWIAVGAH